MMQGYLLNKAARMVMLLIMALFILAAPVQAAVTYDFTATSIVTSWEDFSLRYTDLDGDAHFSLDELVAGSFSGWFWSGPSITFDRIENVPVTSPGSSLTDGDSLDWVFWSSGRQDKWAFYPESYWTTAQSTAAPIPPSALLLGGGLITLLWARRKIRS
jgi:hypothetical protein